MAAGAANGREVNTRELDRLTSKTELTPVSKKVLRIVRRAVEQGRAGEPEIRRNEWVITVQTHEDGGVRCRFDFKSNVAKEPDRSGQ